MAKRKQTTASPENTPMNTASNRKNRSSRVLLRVNQYRFAIFGAEPSSLSWGSRVDFELAESNGWVIAQHRHDLAKGVAEPGPDPRVIHIPTRFAVRCCKPSSSVRPVGADPVNQNGIRTIWAASVSSPATWLSDAASHPRKIVHSDQFRGSARNRPDGLPRQGMQCVGDDCARHRRCVARPDPTLRLG